MAMEVHPGPRPSPQAPKGPGHEHTYHALRRLPLLEAVPDGDLWRAVGAGTIELVAIDRDVFIADPETMVAAKRQGRPPQVMVVASGQLAAGVFDPAVLANRRAEQTRQENMSDEERQQLSLLRPPPLAREARKNLAAFTEGDVFNAAALLAGSHGDVAFYSVAPSHVALIAHDTIAEFAVHHPPFEARLRRAVEVSRDRLRNVAGVKQEILDFFIRQGISVSGQMVRVRQLDSCIDCKLCEQACEERYGAQRLTLGGFQLGMLDFVFTCRTCTDQRCIDPCEYDSIKFDPQRGEVVINESSCVGCTLCAQACPYSAIEMVNVEDPNDPRFKEPFRLRLETEGALAHGPGKPRVARARRIATKCDHCMTYADQACVSACPTGSLIEINAYELFRERPPGAATLARSGYAADIQLDPGEVLPPAPFTKGVGVRNAGMAKVKRRRAWPFLLWGTSIVAWLLALTEILLRLYKPTSSLQYAALREGGLEPAIAQLQVGYRAGVDLAVNCGYVGTALMLVSVLYSPIRRVRAFRKFASNTMWFDFHMMAGTMGPMFILLHSGLKLDNWVSAAFWSMVIVVISGVTGRYLYTQVPDLLNGRELEELDHQHAFQRLRATHPQAAYLADQILGAHQSYAAHVAQTSGMIGSLWWILLEDMKRPWRAARRRALFRGTGVPLPVARELAHRTGRLLLVERRRVLVPRAKLLLHTWKKVHVPFSVIMTAIATVHIWLAFQYSL